MIDMARRPTSISSSSTCRKTVVQWTEAVLNAAHVYFAVLELDLRSAQNVLRMLRALKAEGLPHEKLRFVLNRAPKFTDLCGKSR